MNKKSRSNRPISIGDKAKPVIVYKSKPRVISRNTIMTFGKYKGRMAKELPVSYFQWLRDNTNWKIDNDLF